MGTSAIMDQTACCYNMTTSEIGLFKVFFSISKSKYKAVFCQSTKKMYWALNCGIDLFTARHKVVHNGGSPNFKGSLFDKKTTYMAQILQRLSYKVCLSYYQNSIHLDCLF